MQKNIVIKKYHEKGHQPASSFYQKLTPAGARRVVTVTKNGVRIEQKLSHDP